MQRKPIEIYLLPFFGMLVLAGILFSSTSCQRELTYESDPSVNLRFSSDTVRFDTVFTTLGTVTTVVKVINTSDKNINIDRAYIAGGAASCFRMNISGDTSLCVQNLQIRAKDSVFIFIKATINQNTQNLPFEILDSIVFQTANRTQSLILSAWGQNAYFHLPTGNMTIYTTNDDGSKDSMKVACSFIDASQPLPNDKPHVFYGYAVVQTGTTLIIPNNTQLHFAPKASLLVQSGAKIQVNGTLNNPVVFAGMRTDKEYSDVPGQWNGIILEAGSENNRFEYAIIRNGTTGLQTDSITNDQYAAELYNTIITNMNGIGIRSRGSKILAENCEFSNCKTYVALLNYGGDYSFFQCTFANYFYNLYAPDRDYTPAVWLSNTTLTGTIANPLVNAEFNSCIVYGNRNIEFEMKQVGDDTFSYRFLYSLFRANTSGWKNVSQNVLNCKFNIDPLFKDVNKGNFDISERSSPAVSAGNPSLPSSIPYDIKGRQRPSPPTMGAYEYYSDK